MVCRGASRRGQSAENDVEGDVAASGWPSGSLLGLLPEAAREKLLNHGVLVRYLKPGRVVIREGDPSRFVIVILAGVVKISGSVPGGQDVLLAIRMAGDVVGEFGGIDQQPRSATVTTCGMMIGRLVRAEEFVDCMRRDPVISQAVSKAIVAKMRVARIDFSGSDVLTRVARVLLHLVTVYGQPNPADSHNRNIIGAPLSQSELASLAVASPPAVQRAMRTLRKQGIVSTGYRSIIIEDVERLSQVAYP
jgi:CRP-like cAMP-binding protein